MPTHFNSSRSIAAAVLPPLSVFVCRCTGCKIDISRLPGDARFCPGCGIELPQSGEPTEPGGSTILRGYGAALYLLGWRYETHRNPDEALRCYLKASRLGDPSARARLGTGSASERPS